MEITPLIILIGGTIWPIEMTIIFSQIKRIGEWKPYIDVWDFGNEF